MTAYWGKILEIDLSNGEIKSSEIRQDVFRDFVGGSGLGAWLLFERLNAVISPLSPENPLIVTTGPLTSSKLPGSMTRSSVVSLSPLTNLFCESSNGGSFGHFFKMCGFDGLIVTGVSEKPVRLEIDDEGCRICDASDLWGLDTYETTEKINSIAVSEGKKKPSSLVIGQAGENLVRYANIMNGDSNYAGRGGMGAVMGSKKLKAISARGTSKITFADPEKIDALKSELVALLDENIVTQSMKAFGTGGSIDLASMTGDLPIKNWSDGDWNDVDSINGPTLTDTILTSTGACLGCPVGCKRLVTVPDGEFSMKESAGPEYETVASFGSMLLISDLKAIAKINELCNRYGMDTISCGGTIAFMTELNEKGLLNERERDGLDFRWGTPGPVIEAIKKIATRSGIGDLLADGSREVSRKISRGNDILAEVKGMEAPMHDPRAYWGMGLNYAVGNRGACHVNSMHLMNELGMAFYPEIGLGETVEQFTTSDKAKVTVESQSLGGIVNSTCTCHFPAVPLGVNHFVYMLNATTGFGYTLESMMKAGHRMWLLKRGINNILGVTRKDDILPARLIGPLENGPTTGMKVDIETMLADFYAMRDIDDSGKPSKKILEQHGLDELARRLHG